MYFFTTDQPLQDKNVPDSVPEEPVSAKEPMAEPEAAPTIELKVRNGVSVLD